MTMWCDFETRSECDLKTRGVYNYAQDPSTAVLCMAYAFADEDVELWTPDQPFPARVADHFCNGGRIYAHNAAFERLILWYVICPDFNVPEPALEQFYCTATQARANCMPGSLEDVGRFCGASMKKDFKGKQLVKKCCVPPFKHTADDLWKLFEYCKQDVRAMRAVSKAMRPLSPEELVDYHVNERINDRGVMVDLELAHAAMRYAEQERKEIERLFTEITGLPSVRSPRMREWVYERVNEEGRALMTVDGKISIDKTVRANLLATDLDPDVADVIQCADDIWSSSVAKYQRMVNLAGPDGRVRGAFVFAGGSATGRASSYGLQVHNFPRKVAKDPEAVRAEMLAGKPLKGVANVLKSMLRPTLIGKFTIADWSSIEARVNPWLSGMGNAKLDVFRSGRDPYIVNAAATFKVAYDAVTPEQRQIGKVQELACGFAGGAGAFASMGKIYGVVVPEREAWQMVDAWRAANPWAVPYWQALEQAYWKAMRNPKTEVKVGRIIYMFDGVHLWYMLPSGRVLCYPYARADKEITYAKAAWKPAQDAKEWPRGTLWRGLACENITQAVAHDILRHALRQVDAVLHVHDEIVVEGPADLERVMCTPPDWAKDLPLAAEVKVFDRYQK
jgi:DNA polymerase bacteriophage-type